VGLGTVVSYLGIGSSAGASTFSASALSYVSDRSRFQQYVSSRDWRVVFTLSIILGAAVYAVVYRGGPWTTNLAVATAYRRCRLRRRLEAVRHLPQGRLREGSFCRIVRAFVRTVHKSYNRVAVTEG
jgi:hypothetical protein